MQTRGVAGLWILWEHRGALCVSACGPSDLPSLAFYELPACLPYLQESPLGPSDGSHTPLRFPVLSSHHGPRLSIYFCLIWCPSLLLPISPAARLPSARFAKPH